MHEATLTAEDRHVAQVMGMTDEQMLEAKRQEQLPLEGRQYSRTNAAPTQTPPKASTAGITLTDADREVAAQFGWSDEQMLQAKAEERTRL